MKNDIESFIIRIWSEGIDSKGQVIAWRGSIDHVGTNHRIYFCDLDGIVQFIEDQTGITPNPTKSRWRQFCRWVKDLWHFPGINNNAHNTN